MNKTSFLVTDHCQKQNVFFSNPQNRRALLEHYANTYGDFKIAKGDLNGYWTKHQSVINCNESNNIYLLENAGHRQIFSNELVIDIDRKDTETFYDVEEKTRKIIAQLVRRLFLFKVYFSGSNGYHIHILCPEFMYISERTKERHKETIIKHVDADLHKKSSNVLIALEFAPHWKTGQQKILVFDNTGGDLHDQLFK